MEFSRNSPVTLSTTAIPGSTIVCEFVTIGTRHPIKIDVNTHIYYKHPIHRNMVNVITSDAYSVYTSPVEETHVIKMKIPQYEYRDLFRSFVQIAIDQNENPYTKVFLISILIEESFKYDERKRKDEEERRIKEEQERLEDLVAVSLPKDLLNRIFYIRPWNNDSFAVVSHNHIQYMKENIKDKDNRFEIIDMNWDQIGTINVNMRSNILLHPFLYPFANAESFKKNSLVFSKLLKVKNKIGGFDVADSDRISFLAVNLINKLDLIMVPSNFAKNSFINSGVNIPVEVLHHGVSNEFLDDNSNSQNPEIIKLRKLKQEGNILILYFLAHSEYRKGSDLVRDVMNRIKTKFNNIYLVVKGPNIATFSNIRIIQINSWLNINDLKCLYDICDVCLSPSRGGGFELNALEAISRGVPTLVTRGGCFLDYIDHVIPINTNGKMVQPLPGNQVHVGFGHETDINDFDIKLTNVINNLEEYKIKFKDRSKEIREKYSWKNTAKILEIYLRKYEFVA